MNCIILLEARGLSLSWKNTYVFLSTCAEYLLCAKCDLYIILFSVDCINNFTVRMLNQNLYFSGNKRESKGRGSTLPKARNLVSDGTKI